MRKIVPVIACMVAFPAAAMDLSDTALDGLMRVTLANTAKQQCVGASVNDKRMQDEMVAVLGGIAKEGINPVEAVQFLETEEGQKAMSDREAAFRARHGVDATGYPALCAAIKLELETDEALARIVTLK